MSEKPQKDCLKEKIFEEVPWVLDETEEIIEKTNPGYMPKGGLGEEQSLYANLEIKRKMLLVYIAKSYIEQGKTSPQGGLDIAKNIAKCFNFESLAGQVAVYKNIFKAVKPVELIDSNY